MAQKFNLKILIDKCMNKFTQFWVTFEIHPIFWVKIYFTKKMSIGLLINLVILHNNT